MHSNKEHGYSDTCFLSVYWRRTVSYKGGLQHEWNSGKGNQENNVHMNYVHPCPNCAIITHKTRGRSRGIIHKANNNITMLFKNYISEMEISMSNNLFHFMIGAVVSA